MQETVGETQAENSSMKDEDPNPEDELETGSEDHWDFQPGNRTAVCLAGEADAYDQCFILFMELSLSSDAADLEEIHGVVDSDGQFTDEIDLDQSPYRVKQQLLKVMSGVDPSQLKDSKNLVNKCKQTINQRDNLSEIGEGLQQDDAEGVESFFKDLLDNEIYPGSNINLTVKIGSNLDPEPTTPEPDEPDEDGEEPEPEDEGPMFLEVVPEVNPARGVPLRELNSGDEIEVRVIGDSVRQLRDQFRSPDEEEGQQLQSKPLYSKLLKIESTGDGDESIFLVKITNEVFGKGTVDANTMVELRREDDIPSHIQIRRSIFKLLIGVLIFVFSASLLILVFPDSFFDLLKFF